tara:strand:+ start:1696 stop:2229 length:534 start_codon:yes stop_codon:yes gene_type:complete
VSTRRRYFPTTLALALAATLASGLAFAESATTLRATEMLSEPLGSAEVVAKLGAKAPVDITGRKGAWAGVKNAEGLDGWVRVLNLRTGTSDGKAAGGGNQLAAAFLTGSSGNTVSTGVKGLSPEKLRNAGSAPSEVEMLDQLAASPDDARLFAMSASLEAHQVDYLKSDRRSRRKQR